MESPTRDLVFETMPFPVLLLDAKLRVLDLNPAAEQLFDQSVTTAFQRNLGEWLHEDCELLAFLQTAKKDEVSRFEAGIDLEFLNGNKVTAEARFAPCVQTGTPSENWASVLSLFPTVVPDRMKNGAHQQSSLPLTTLVAMLAHEIKNPLSGIRGAAQLLEMSVDENEADLPRMITSEVDRLTTLIDEMEGFSDTRPLNMEQHNIHSILDRCNKVANVGFAQNIRCVEHYDPSLPELLCDQDLLVQVFLNLLKNAAEALTKNGNIEQGVITLSTAYQSGVRLGSRDSSKVPMLVVSVEDNGEGVPEDIRKELFQPSVSGKKGGKGFGLALAAKYVSAHGGWIDFTSKDRRTCFSVHLPIRTNAK